MFNTLKGGIISRLWSFYVCSSFTSQRGEFPTMNLCELFTLETYNQQPTTFSLIFKEGILNFQTDAQEKTKYDKCP